MERQSRFKFLFLSQVCVLAAVERQMSVSSAASAAHRVAAAPQSVTCQAERRRARRRCLVLKVGCALVYVCVRYYCAPSWPGCDSARRSERAGAIIRVALLTDRPETLQQQSSSRRPPTSCRRGAANHNRSRALFIYIFNC